MDKTEVLTKQAQLLEASALISRELYANVICWPDAGQVFAMYHLRAACLDDYVESVNRKSWAWREATEAAAAEHLTD